MRTMSRTARLIALATGPLLVASVVAATSGPGVPQEASAHAQEPAPEESFFGYQPGEERVYRLGPPDSLVAGESAEWTLTFAGFRHSDDGEVAEMDFSHHRFELYPGNWNPAEEIMEVRVQGRALLTRDGFPLQVEFEQSFVHQGERLAEDGRRRATFTYLNDSHEYRKDLKVGSRDWDFEFRVPTYRGMDLDRHRGLFLYMPSSLGCLGSSRQICVADELAFANPGFLAVVLPYLLEEHPAERDFMFFRPDSIGASPFRPMVAGEWLSRERSNLGSQRRYFERWKLKLGTSDEVQVGPRKMHAWEMKMGGGIDRVWVEPSGRVLRVDLETGIDNPDPRYIRLVFPYEEFVSPNDDPAEDCCG